MGLSQAVHTPNPLLQARRIPGRLEIDHGSPLGALATRGNFPLD
jgi:hypothetical protein